MYAHAPTTEWGGGERYTTATHRLCSLVISFLLRQERFFLSDGYTVMVVFETAKCAHWIIGVVIKGGVTDVARA